MLRSRLQLKSSVRACSRDEGSVCPAESPSVSVVAPGLETLTRRTALRRLGVSTGLTAGLATGAMTAVLAGLGGAASAFAQEPQASKPGAGTRAVPNRLRVVASFSILADMTRQVGGDAVVVWSLVGPNADAHAYAPSPADVKRVAAANLVIVNGLRFEGWLDRLIAASGYRGKVIVGTKGVVPRLLGGEPDPHAWQSLANALLYVENIRAALVAAMPIRAAAIDERARDYTARIRQLDQDARARFERMPPEHRRIITSHDAFGYLGASYGIDFISPQGRTTDSEASAADVARVIRQLKERQARALFVENITDPRLIQRIAKEAGIVAGGALYSDALSPPGSAADTYLKMYAHNVDALATALAAAPLASAASSPSPSPASGTSSRAR
jgi:zinc/manganese transport system substrate-binding protein